MADQHPITPPTELVEQWLTEGHHQDYCSATNHAIAQAARWGADQELEACCEWLQDGFGDIGDFPEKLRAARRPKPPSLAEEALKGPSDEELAECYRKAYYAHKDRQGPAAQVAALRAVLAKWGRQ